MVPTFTSTTNILIVGDNAISSLQPLHRRRTLGQTDELVSGSQTERAVSTYADDVCQG